MRQGFGRNNPRNTNPVQMELNMKLYILRWNPNFSMKYTYFNSMMDYLRENEIDTFDWSIYDHEDLEEGDMFILAQVGTGIYDGIAAFGLFSSDTYADKNWKENDGTNRFYAKMSMHCLISHESNGSSDSFEEISPFCAEELEKLFPSVNWHKGHAGVLIPEDTVEPLVLHLMKHTLHLSHGTDRIAFTEQNKNYPLRSYFAKYINGLCPLFKQKIIDSNKLVYENYNEGETIDKSLVEISEKKFGRVKLSKDSSEEDFTRFFVPVA